LFGLIAFVLIIFTTYFKKIFNNENIKTFERKNNIEIKNLMNNNIQNIKINKKNNENDIQNKKIQNVNNNIQNFQIKLVFISDTHGLHRKINIPFGLFLFYSFN
jgi:hypothetical protein